MLYQVMDGSVSPGGHPVLSHFDFEIKGCEKIAVVGRNGAGKTTLLRVLAGELALDRDDKRNGPGIATSRKVSVGMLHQQAFAGSCRTVEEELLEACPCKDTFDPQRFAYEQEYDRLFTGFGFAKEDKHKRLTDFSGGEQTKIALIRLLLAKPDILLLDEPTNHLDEASAQWLEQYLKTYGQAVVMVSHDRFFLDQVAQVVYELEGGKAFRYVGGYTQFRQEKQKRFALMQKAWERQQQESARLEALVERFKHKPTKASFARAKKKQKERMGHVERPLKEEAHLFTGEIRPAVLGGKWVMEAEHLKIGYQTPLLELSLRIRRGQKIGLIGPNGVGKTTFLKTIAGLLPALAGKWHLGNHITVGYFDQLSAQIQSEKTVIEHFCGLFPSLTEKEARDTLGAYLFRGREASRRVSDLSGGEKSRLVLAELLQSRPNFLILDEPTNHMDIPAKETLESAFQAYTGTILFVSHDRYFIQQVAQSLLIFQEGQAFYYPFGYGHYQSQIQKKAYTKAMGAQMRAEDQALVASLRAVPRAERHRLREIPTEEAYGEWKLRVALEQAKAAGGQYEEWEKQAGALLCQWQSSEGFWKGEDWENQKKYEDLRRKAGEAWRQWHECCLAWGDICQETSR
ncbi:MAG: ABC-F family ATP-binding cassette domain-containing protein [Lachnospiraceae bacterium]|nr:ABC-F family ATP-binding cassette domain-containing protein [Lachnospiraceae bacterium]